MILREIKNIYIKNRLTEGVDFKRYEWLKGDGSARFKWSANLWNNQLHTIIGKQQSDYFINSNYSSNTTNIRIIYHKSEDLLMVIFRSGSDNSYHIADYNPFSTMPNVVDFKFYIDNGVGYCERNGSKITGHTMLSYWQENVELAVYAGKMQLLEEYNSTTGARISSLTPCQLLKSIPATLDANNIARQAGECGMYDSISGKFYGNVANTGTFTVEGEVEPETHTGLQQIYQNRLIEGVDYETADWLKMDIPESIIIDMMSLPINSNNVEFKRNWIQITNSEYFRTSNYIYYITDYGDMHDLHPMVWSITPSQIRYIGNINLGLGLHTIITNSNGVTISANSKVASLSWYGNQIVYMKFNSMMIFNTKTIHLTSSIKVDGVIRYVPCTLLRSIPRNLDAQCKERVAGECGMVDLISGKFYGNVASSGTFTVENNTENNE